MANSVSILAIAACAVLLADLANPVAGYSAGSMPGLRSAASPSMAMGGNAPLSRRRIVQGIIGGIAIGAPAAAFAEEAAEASKDAPKKKKMTAQEKEDEKARLEQQAEDNAQAFDASMGLFGCSFWGLKKKENSGACEPRTK